MILYYRVLVFTLILLAGVFAVMTASVPAPILGAEGRTQKAEGSGPLTGLEALEAKPELIGTPCHVIDADTFGIDVIDLGCVYPARIWGIDGAEREHRNLGFGLQPGALEGMNYLNDLTRGKQLDCVIRRRDQHDRIVVSCLILPVADDLSSGRPSEVVRDLGNEMVRRGWAWPYVGYGGTRYCHAWREAEDARLGLWSLPGPMIAPQVWRGHKEPARCR